MNMGYSKVLLVEPTFPVPRKSRFHRDFFPIGLLKIGAHLRDSGAEVQLVHGEVSSDALEFEPDAVFITSLFTYWSDWVRRCVAHYKGLLPGAHTVVGGIYASLMPEHCRDYTGCDRVFVGLHSEAESLGPAYDLLDTDVDFQVLHASRGCTRRCAFCGAWRLEREFKPKRSVIGEICKTHLIFYDNNLLANPYIENILREIIGLREKGEVQWCESQSGFDGRVILKKPALAKLLRDAGFRYPRIAWDHAYADRSKIRDQIETLINAGYQSRDVFVFMLYNYEIPFDDLERKRKTCWDWRVQIADCRYRPLDLTHDGYNPYTDAQNSNEYFIHQRWTDKHIRTFRRNVRRQNICVRYRLPFYSAAVERKRAGKDLTAELKRIESRRELVSLLIEKGLDYWFPD